MQTDRSETHRIAFKPIAWLAAAILVATVSISPARADRDDEHHRDDRYREHEEHHKHWHEYERHVYSPPPVVYGPPPGFYAPPPPVVYAPPPPTFSIVIPVSIH